MRIDTRPWTLECPVQDGEIEGPICPGTLQAWTHLFKQSQCKAILMYHIGFRMQRNLSKGIPSEGVLSFKMPATWPKWLRDFETF